MEPNWRFLIALFIWFTLSAQVDGKLNCTEKNKFMGNVKICSQNSGDGDCRDLESKSAFILLKNVQNTMNTIPQHTQREFEEAVSQLYRRIVQCNPIIMEKMWQSIEGYSVFNDTICMNKEQICRQNQLYLYPMYCTAREHLFDFNNKLNYTQLLRLQYAKAYALQMINSNSPNNALNCDRLYDIRSVYFKPNHLIDSAIMIDEDRLCKYFTNLNYNLYADKEDVKFKDCQKTDETERLSNKIKAHIKRCEEEIARIFKWSN